jgi:hypothetical protein
MKQLIMKISLSYSYSSSLSSKYSLGTLFPNTTIQCSPLNVEDQVSQFQDLIFTFHISVFISLKLIKLIYIWSNEQGRYFQEADS